MHITKRQEKTLNELAKPLENLINSIKNASDDDLPKVLNSNLVWDTSKGTLLNWVDILNKFDSILEGIIKKYGLADENVKPTELDAKDTTLTVAILDFTYMLLDNSSNKSVYSSSHRLYDLLASPTIPVIKGVLKCFVVLGKKYSIRSMKRTFVATRKVSDRVYPLALLLPASTLTSNTGSNENCSLTDFIKDSTKVPKKWRNLDYTYYNDTEKKEQPQDSASLVNSPSVKRIKNQEQQTDSSPIKPKKQQQLQQQQVKSEDNKLDGPLLFHLSESEVRKLSLQQIYDKGIEKLPSKSWFRFCLKSIMAKAFNSNSYENIKLRQDLIVIKCLAVSLLVSVNSDFEVTSRVFEADPSLLSSLVDLVNLQSSVPEDVRMAAIKSLDCISSLKTWSSEILRNLGGSVSHGLLFQNLRFIIKQIKENDKHIDEEFNTFFLNVISNLVEVKSLSTLLISAGLIQTLMEFLNLKSDVKKTTAAATYLLNTIVTSSSENVSLFREMNGFNSLLNMVGYEIDFALENPGYGGGPPKLTVVHYSISFRQANYIRSLLKFVHSLIQSESGDRVRNLFDSPLLGHLNKILQNISVFGFTLLTLSLNVVCAIIHNEPTSYSILKEAGTIDLIVDGFETFFGKSSELITTLPNVIGAIALNTEGLQKVKDGQLIQKFFTIFDNNDYAKALVIDDISEFMGSAIDELARHYPDLKPIILDEIVSLIKRLPSIAAKTLPGPQIYTSEKGSFYHSKEDEVIDNEEGQSQIAAWETLDEAYAIENATVFIGNMIPYSNTWTEIMDKLPFEHWLPLLTLKNASYDYVYSNSMYPVNGVLKYFDDERREYAPKKLIAEIAKQVSSVRDYFESTEEVSLFQKFEGDSNRSNDLLNRLIAVNNILFAFVDVYCNPNSLSPTRVGQLAIFFSEEKGLELINQIGQLLRRVTFEEYALRSSMPDVVAKETIPNQYDDGCPPLRIVTGDENPETKFNKSSAKFKNTLQTRFLINRIHGSISLVFNTLLALPTVGRQEYTVDLYRGFTVQISHEITKIFQGYLVSELYNHPSFLLVLINTIQYCLTDSNSDKILTIAGINFMQQGGFLAQRDILLHFWSKLSSLNKEKADEAKDLTFVRDTPESIVISLVMNLLVMFNKITVYESLVAVSNSPLYYEGDITGTSNIPVHNLTVSFLVQSKLLGFGVLSGILDEDSFGSVEDELPLPVVFELIKLGKHVYSNNGEKYLNYSDGALYELDWKQAKDSHSRMEYLQSLGFTEEQAPRIINKSGGDLSVLDDDAFPGVAITPKDWENAKSKAVEKKYIPPKPKLVTPQYLGYHTITELEEARQGKSDYFLDQCLLIAQLYPSTVQSVSEYLVSSYLNSPKQNVVNFEANILRTLLEYLYSFDISNQDSKELGSMFHLFTILISNNDTIFYGVSSTLKSFASFVIESVKSEYVNCNWFPQALFGMEKILATSDLPKFEKAKVNVSCTIPKSFPSSYELEDGLRESLFEILINVGEITNHKSALAISRLLVLYTSDPEKVEKVVASGIIQKITKVISQPIEKEKENSFALQAAFVLLVRRCFETKDIVDSLILREINKQFISKSRRGDDNKDRSRDLTSLLKEIPGVVLRAPQVYLEELSKRARFSDFSDPLKNLSVRLVESADEDVPMIDAETGEKVETTDSGTKLHNQTGIVHLLLTELMSTAKKDWISEPPVTDKEREEQEKEKEKNELPKPRKVDIHKNSNCSYMLFLLKVITELLASYKQSKLEFLTFSKKQLFQSENEGPSKPRSTSLNFFLHQLIQSAGTDLTNPEDNRKRAVSDLTCKAIVAFISTIDQGSLKADPKKVDPDMTFIRKFTVDSILKVVKDISLSSHNMQTRYKKLISLNKLIPSLLSKSRDKLVEASTVEFDSFHVAKTMIDAGLPQALTGVLTEIDLNYPEYYFILDSVVTALSTIASIKTEFQQLFKDYQPNGVADEEELEEDENDFKEETPDLFRNSTLGMYDVGEIDSEEDASDEEMDYDEDDFDEEDVDRSLEIVYSEDEDDIIGSDDGEVVDDGDIDNENESAGESDQDSEDSFDSDDSDQTMEGHEGDEEMSEFQIIPEMLSEEEVDDEISDYENSMDHEHDHDDHFDSEIESELDQIVEQEEERTPGPDGSRMDAPEDNEVFIHVDEDENEDESDISSSSDIFEIDPSNMRAQGDRHRQRFTHNHRPRRFMLNVEDLADMAFSGNDRNYTSILRAGLERASSQLNAFPQISNLDFFNRENLRRMLTPSAHQKLAASEFSLKSTKERWNEVYSMFFGKSGDSLRILTEIVNRIFEPSEELYNKKKAEEEERRKKEDEEAKKHQAEAEERRQKEEAERRASQPEPTEPNSLDEPVNQDPIYVMIGDREVDIAGTDIDPEFFEALPDYMREEVFTQHVRERRAEASNAGNTTREIDQDFLDALPDGIREEILAQEAMSTRLPNLVVDSMGGDDTRLVPNESENAGNSEVSGSKEKSKTFFTPLVDRFGVASLVRFVFVPQSFQGRKTLYGLLGQLCINKQSRAEVLGYFLAILQEGLSDQQSLEKTFHQICGKAKCTTGSLYNIAPGVKPSTPRTPSTPASGKTSLSVNQFPNRATPFIVAGQVLEALQFLLESDPHLRYYFLSEHEPLMLGKKSKQKKDIFGKQSKYPLNTLLSLLDRGIVKEKSVLMDLLSRIIQITTRPLNALLKAQNDKVKPEKEGDESEKSRKNIELPNVMDSSLSNVVTALSADDCSSRTFQQTLSAMQNLLVIKSGKKIFASELSSSATKLGKVIVTDLATLIEELKDHTEDLSADVMAKFTSSSSDQAKLLRVLTALDYLFGKLDDKELELKELTNLYKKLSLGPLWGALSDCLHILEDNKNITHTATALLPLIEALMVVCKHSKVKELQAKDALKYENKKCDFVNEPIESLFFSFTDTHKKILNQMVRSNAKLMSGPFAMLVRNPRVLEFDNKKNYFDRKLHTKENEKQTMAVSIRRDQVFLDSYRALFFKSSEEFRNAKLDISFKGEAGIDAGGVTREWYQVLSRQMFNPDYALFLPVASDKTTFHPNRTSWVNPEHLSFFKFIGRVIGKAIYDNCFLDCHFSRDVYKSILGRSVSLKDLETIDLEYFKSLMWMLENDITDIIIETFAVETEDYGEVKIIDLIPDGRNIAVTEDNKQEYVRLVVEYRLQKSVEEQVSNFLQGFHEIIPKELISIFDEQELELLISGLPDIDVDDWKNNTTYVNYSPSSKEISYFWRAVRSFDAEERAKLLQFATGTSKVPLNGFKELGGSNGTSKFSIHRDFGSTERLPSSHTCFNQIDLPAYDSYETLRGSLLLAITEGHEGFGLA